MRGNESLPITLGELPEFPGGRGAAVARKMARWAWKMETARDCREAARAAGKGAMERRFAGMETETVRRMASLAAWARAAAAWDAAGVDTAFLGDLDTDALAALPDAAFAEARRKRPDVDVPGREKNMGVTAGDIDPLPVTATQEARTPETAAAKTAVPPLENAPTIPTAPVPRETAIARPARTAAALPKNVPTTATAAPAPEKIPTARYAAPLSEKAPAIAALPRPAPVIRAEPTVPARKSPEKQGSSARSAPRGKDEAPKAPERPRGRPDPADVIDYDIHRIGKGRAGFTGGDVVATARRHGIPPELLAAFLRNDSSYGKEGFGKGNNNPGNIGQFDHLKTPVKGYENPTVGLDAAASYLARRVRKYRAATGRDDWTAREIASGHTRDGRPFFFAEKGKGGYMTKASGPDTVQKIYDQLVAADIKGAPWKSAKAGTA